MGQVSYGTITITDITDIDSVKNWYLATSASSGVTKSTSGWTDTIQQMTTNKQYLWSYEQILAENGDEISSTQPVIIGHFGVNGTNGVDGNSITSIDEYYKVTNSTTNPGSSGWQKNTLVTPTSSNKYLWNYQVINYSKTSPEGSYSDARIIGVYGDTGPQGPQGPQGDPGTAGINTATVYLYQRAASAPTKPSGNLTYTFASAKITSGTLGNWKQSIGELTGTDPIWVIAAVASSNGTTDVIASSEWSDQIKLAQNGTDGINGTNGTNGTNGLNQATVYIYKRAASATAPSATTYTFSNGSFTVPSGWSKTIPASNGSPCYVSSAVAIGNGTTATLTWNTPSVLVEDGTDGISPTVVQTSTGVEITDASGNKTTITNGTNGQSYYTYIRYADDSSGSNMSSSPTGKTYIGVYSGTASTAPTTPSSYAPWMKYIGTDGQPGAQGVSVTKVRELYYLTNGNAPSKPTSSTTIYDDDRVGAWTSVMPSYIVNGKYYLSLETTLSNNTKTFSDVVLDEATTESNYNAYLALSISQNANENSQGAMGQATEANYKTEALAAKVKHYWWDSTGAHIASGINGADVTEETASTYGFNSLVGLASMTFGYNSYKTVELDGSVPALKFYKPSKTAQGALTATLDSNGLVLSEGGVQAGTAGQSGFIYLSTKNYGSNLTINSHQASNWREIIGTKFGVDADGNLYATSANITGAIVATSLDLTTNNVKIGSGSVNGLSTVATSGSYNDLSNKPTIPSLTGYIYQDGTVGSTPADGATGFVVSSSGALQASNAIIYGSLYASKGYVGGWQIGTDGNKSLHNGNANTSPTPAANVVILSKGITTTSVIGNLPAATYAITSGTNFGVTTNGVLHSASGKIGGINISASSIYSGSKSSYNSSNTGFFLGSDGKFGVGTSTNYLTFDGTNVNIKGGITATSLTISSGATVSGVVVPNDISDMATNAKTDWLVEVTTTGTPDFVTPSITLKAVVYHRGSLVTSGFTRNWYKNGTGNSLGSGETITVSDMDAYYVCIVSETS